MSFLQLYYTSCERGLSGYAGYQFNAVTPGTSADTRGMVESLTGYEAPHSFAYTADREALAGCPVDLCYAPGSTTVVANVQYVGHDASKRRFGNYFAHALATTEPGTDLSDVLPIELWRAPFWAADPVQSLELPPLDGPLTPGPLSRSETGRFIAAHPHREQLPALLSAVGRSCEGTDRPVLVVAETADEVAWWFAAISYLLPEQFVRHLSFATYLSRPTRSRLHLRGTVAETNLDLGADATENFCLFDFSRERFSPLPEHPLAQLTTKIDVPVAGALWTWAQALASGEERSFDDWYPVTAAAAALGQIELGTDDVAAAAAWLDRASHLPPGRQSEIAWTLHDCPALTRRQLRLVRNVAKRNGDQELYEQSQCELLEADMLAAMRGQQAASGPEPITEAPIRDKMAARCQEAFQHCDSPQRALLLLDWAAGTRLTLDPDVVTGSTRRLIAPWLTTDIPGHPLGDELRVPAHRVASTCPQFRAGLVGWLTDQGAPGQPVIGAAMSGLVGELLVEEDLAGHTALGELYLVCDARRGRDRPVAVLIKIARRRGEQSVDEPLLRVIWPSGGWTRTEAFEVLHKLGKKQQYGEGVPAWFYQASETELPPADIELQVTLCRMLLASPIARSLTDVQIEQLRATLTIVRVTHVASELAQLTPIIAAYRSSQSPAIRQLVRNQVPVALIRVNADPGDLAEALPTLDAGSFSGYIGQVERGLLQSTAGIDRHLAALWLFGYTRTGPRAEQAGKLIDYAVNHWHRRDLDRLAKVIDGANTVAGAEFHIGVKAARAGLSRRVARSTVGKVTTFARNRLNDSGANRDGSAEPDGPAKDSGR